MDPIIKEQRIASLILKERWSDLSETEKAFLDSWRKESYEHEALYQRLCHKDFSTDLSRYKQIDVRKGLARYNKRYPHKTEKRISNRWYWAAAAVVLLFLGGISLYLQQNGEGMPVCAVVPGTSKAILVLSEGETIDLTQKKKQIVSTQKLTVNNDGSELQYIATGPQSQTDSLNYNEIIIPRGGEYTLSLADGTKVWLNSQTRLRFPVAFGKDRRDVYLEGEAYFDVAKDSLRPFHVNLSKVDIEVLGTSFNVRGYADESDIETVLEEGRVQVKYSTGVVVLKPGDKAVYNSDGRMEVKPVDTELYTAWHLGRYVFDKEPLENILRLFARWYDIEVFYMNESAKSVLISGDVRRYDEINTLLDAIEIAGGVHCRLTGKTLVVGCE